MANVAKINGYDVKDAVARGDIADIQQDLSTAQGDITTLQGDVSDTKADLGDITALDTTVKTSAVNAINEVNGKAEDNADNIGTLANLTTTAKTDLVSAINELDSHADTNTANFAPAFSEVTSYAVGDYVTYNNILYRCTTAHTAGVWVAGHFTQVTVGGQLKVQDISSSITIGDGYASGQIYVFRDGNTVQVMFNSVQTTGYGKTICSGLPKPLHSCYFCVQADGDPQELGLAGLTLYGSIESGSNTAGMGPSKVWDGFITYLTSD